MLGRSKRTRRQIIRDNRKRRKQMPPKGWHSMEKRIARRVTKELSLKLQQHPNQPEIDVEETVEEYNNEKKKVKWLQMLIDMHCRECHFDKIFEERECSDCVFDLINIG